MSLRSNMELLVSNHGLEAIAEALLVSPHTVIAGLRGQDLWPSTQILVTRLALEGGEVVKYLRNQPDGPYTREYRTALGLNRYEFAELVGVSYHTVYRWEAGKVVPQGPVIRLAQLARRTSS